MERVGESVLQRHGQLERLPGVAQVGLAVARQLAGLGERDEVRTHRVAPFVRSDEPERGQHAGRFRHEHRAHAELLCQLARVQRAGAAERDEREAGRIVAALDRDDA